MSSPPIDETLDRVYRRAHQIRRHRRLRLVPLALLAIALAVTPLVIVTTRADESSQVVTDDGTTLPLPPTPDPGSVFYGVA